MSSADKQIEKIYETLKRRGEEWPQRGPAWHKFNKEIEQFYLYLTDNPNFKTLSKSDFPLLNFEKTENSPIFICGNLKSGTSLLLQLSDNHENIFSMPGDSFFIKRFSDSKNININETAKYWLKRMMNPTGQEPFLPYGKSESLYQNFINFLFYFISEKQKEIFKSVVFSFIISVKNKNTKKIKYWVEKTPLNELYTEKLLRLFPKAKFINVVRDPIQNIISLKRLYKIRNRKSNMLQKALFQVFLIKR
ncbi:MAG: sulfotransferase, partial [Bacteroidales bacterium]|nr:sulfotransferase [Bacteroidales bacterium]